MGEGLRHSGLRLWLITAKECFMQINASIPPVDFNPAVRLQTDKPVETKKPEVKNVEKTEPATDKKENLEKLKNVLAENNITLKYTEDQDTKELVVKLVDSQTGESIRQIPSEISLKLAAIFVKMQGQFVDKKE